MYVSPARLFVEDRSLVMNQYRHVAHVNNHQFTVMITRTDPMILSLLERTSTKPQLSYPPINIMGLFLR